MIGLVSVPILVNIRLPDASQLSQAALQVGILLSALTVPMAMAAIPGGWLSERIGYRWTTTLGLGLALIGFAAIWQTWTLDVADGVIAVEMALVGVGLGLTFSPISASVINAADQDKLGVGVGAGDHHAPAGHDDQRLGADGVRVAAAGAAGGCRTGSGGGLDPMPALDVYRAADRQVLTEMGLLGAADLRARADPGAAAAPRTRRSNLSRGIEAARDSRGVQLNAQFLSTSICLIRLT